MTNSRYGSVPCKKYIRHLSLLVGIALVTSLIVASISIASAQAHQPPNHKTPTFQIEQFGALGDGKTDDTKAIEAAIAAAVKARGGNLTAVAGTYCFSGPLTLPNGVSLAGASMSTVIFKPTKAGAAFILQGVSAISLCTIDAQPGEEGYFYGTPDPNPTKHSVDAAAGASPKLTSVNFSSANFLDCNAVTMLSCTVSSTVGIFGGRNIVMEKVNFDSGYLNVNPDSNQKSTVGLSLISCTWAPTGGNSSGANIIIGGGIAKGATQGMESCNFADNEVIVLIHNDKSVAYTYFRFANNMFSGASMESTFLVQNANPNVLAYVTGNHFNTTAITGLPFAPISAIVSAPLSAGPVGGVFFNDNDVWASVVFAGGRVSATGNNFSHLGQIQCELGTNSPAWVGPLNISSNTFTLTGQKSVANNVCPILVTLSPTDSEKVTGPVMIENNKCTSTVPLPGYIVVLDAPNDRTVVSGNTVKPTGAVTAVVHTQAAYDALMQQLGE